jgi:hypothetical protein
MLGATPPLPVHVFMTCTGTVQPTLWWRRGRLLARARASAFAVTSSVTSRHPLWECFPTTVAAATQFYICTPCKLSFTESLTVGVTAHSRSITHLSWHWPWAWTSQTSFVGAGTCRVSCAVWAMHKDQGFHVCWARSSWFTFVRKQFTTLNIPFHFSCWMAVFRAESLLASDKWRVCGV